jgi:hypothetical protein
MKRSGESGYAMLLVFAMAATVGIMLYMQLPSIVFEAQRQKEELLIERGEQYQRAIQLYFRKFKTFPPNLDALENTNNIRFLRRRYEDPMTGKKEWRLVHVGNGIYIDSLIHKPDQQQEQKNVNTFITEGPAVGSTGPAEGASAAAAVWMRARRGMPVPSPGAEAPGQEGQEQPPQGGTPALAGVAYTGPDAQPGEPGAANDPSPDEPGAQDQPGMPGQPGAVPGQPGFPNPRAAALPPGAPGTPHQGPAVGSGFPGGYQQPGSPPQGQTVGSGFIGGYQQPGSPSQGQAVGSGFIGGYQPPGSQAATPGSPQPGMQPGGPTVSGGFGGGFAPNPGQPTQGSNEAIRMIQGLLTRPRPGGLTGASGTATAGTLMGGSGVAGVASTLEAVGIKVYNERDKYNEWEFLYDPSKDRTGAGMSAGGQVGTPIGQPGPAGQSAFGGGAVESPFGNQPPPGFNPPSAFGQAPGFRQPSPAGLQRGVGPQFGAGRIGQPVVGQTPGFGGFPGGQVPGGFRPPQATPAPTAPGGGSVGSGFGSGFGSSVGSGFGSGTSAPAPPGPPPQAQPQRPVPPQRQQPAPGQQNPAPRR